MENKDVKTVVGLKNNISDLEKQINDLLLKFVQKTGENPIVGVIRQHRDIVKITVQL